MLIFFSFLNGLLAHISEQRQAFEQLMHWTLLHHKFMELTCQIHAQIMESRIEL